MACVDAVGCGDVDGSDAAAVGGDGSTADAGDAAADGAGAYWRGNVLVTRDGTAPTVHGRGDPGLLDTNGQCGYETLRDARRRASTVDTALSWHDYLVGCAPFGARISHVGSHGAMRWTYYSLSSRREWRYSSNEFMGSWLVLYGNVILWRVCRDACRCRRRMMLNVGS